MQNLKVSMFQRPARAMYRNVCPGANDLLPQIARVIEVEWLTSIFAALQLPRV